MTALPEPTLWRVVVAAPSAMHEPIAAALEDAEALSAFEQGPGGAWRIEALFSVKPDAPSLTARFALAAALAGGEAPDFAIAPVEAIDWLAENRKDFPPLRVGRFWIAGEHVRVAPPPGAHVVRLDAGIAFGSGEHATTKLCLEAIGAARRRPRRAQDVGCGSGILAIAMAKRWPGVKPGAITAIDIDRDSVAVARANARRNAVARAIGVKHGDGPTRHRAGLIVANILARPLVRLAKRLARALAGDGRLVLSGLLVEQEATIIAAYRRTGLFVRRRRRLGNWSALVLARAGAKRR